MSKLPWQHLQGGRGVHSSGSGLGFDLPVVRDFGLVAAMDMLLAVAAALVLLPAIVVRVGLIEPVRVHFTPEAKVALADAPA